VLVWVREDIVRGWGWKRVLSGADLALNANDGRDARRLRPERGRLVRSVRGLNLAGLRYRGRLVGENCRCFCFCPDQGCIIQAGCACFEVFLKGDAVLDDVGEVEAELNEAVLGLSNSVAG
jgi:hypothetical protein